ncbi:MAG: hypothetical protein WCS85_04795 [Candidatus Peribacteraceae bacterium]
MLESIVLAAVTALIVVYVITAVAHIVTQVPYVGTPRKIVDSMVRLAGFRGDETVVDIGAGDGRVLVAAKKHFPGIRAIGYENALGIWLYGKLKIFLSGAKVHFRFRNALKDDLSVADVIFLYLGPDMMRKLEPIFDRVLRPGTRVVSHAFTFPTKQPVREEKIPWGRRTKRVLLYEW